MTTRDKTPIGSPCWTDLWTSDPKTTSAFYGDLFGWEAQEPSPALGGYFMFTRNGVPVAGGMGDMGDVPANNTWKIYLASTDAARTTEAAEAAGAQVVSAAMPVADLGVQAVLVDPTGADVGVWEPRAFPGITVLNERGAPSWFELHTRDHDRAVAFYRSVFHWQTNAIGDTDGFRYTTMRDPASGTELAGIMNASQSLPDDAPAAWVVYFDVDDTDLTLEHTEELGGYIVRAAEDTPYGRIAIAADPCGAEFFLISPVQGAATGAP
jgi:hypothetical protein